MNSSNTLIYSTLKNTFGFDTFRDGQETVITKILESKSALAVFPTGSGKSLCYQLSAVLLDDLTLVISPLIALMKDQIDFLRTRNIPAARLDSTVELNEIRRIDADLQAGRLKLLYVAPERFSNERFIQKLRRLKIALMVIDEAHCISEWGHNFRPDYLKLARTARSLGVPRVLTLTATATRAVAEDICREFDISSEDFVHTGFYRPNLTLLITPCRSNEQIELLLRRLRQRPRGPTIVYVTLQRTAETVAETLCRNGLPALAYHAGLPNEQREAAQNQFMESAEAIVVATIAFGMGIDKSDIRYVYHYNLPKSLESYSQEIGRAGRDGNDSICEMLACGSDVTVLENFTYGDTPDPESVFKMVDAVVRHDGEFDLSFYELSRTYDIRPLVVSTLLTYLELAEVIESTEPFYNEYQFVPLRPSKEILSKYDAARAAFLSKIFSSATKKQKWFSIDLETTISRLDTSRSRLIKALNYLEEQGDLTLKVAGLRQGYRIKKSPADVSALKQKLLERFQTRERNDIDRVRQVVRLTQESGCIVRRLLEYFGEDLGRDCGHCGNCYSGFSGGGIQIGGESTEVKLDRGKIATLQKQNPKALGSIRQLTRFLCGLNSPSLTQAKLNKHGEFGSLAEVPFDLVMKAAETITRPEPTANRIGRERG